MKFIRIALPLLALCGATIACGLTDKVEDTVKTVNKAVNLLTEISESGTWTYIGEGIDALDKANGYAATATMTSGATNDTGETITQVNRQVVWTITTDADKDSLIRVQQGASMVEYLRTGNDTYRIENGQYACETSINTNEEFFAGNVGDLFITYSANAIGVQAISVAERTGTATVNGFETTQYRLVSKLQEALDILKEFDDAQLRSDIENVPPFYIDGALSIDNATKALIRFQATYADLERKEGNTFVFDVTALGNQPDIPAPDPSLITTPCQ